MRCLAARLTASRASTDNEHQPSEPPPLLLVAVVVVPVLLDTATSLATAAATLMLLVVLALLPLASVTVRLTLKVPAPVGMAVTVWPVALLRLVTMPPPLVSVHW